MQMKKEDFEELERLPSNPHKPCYKIRRLSDNEIFTWQVLQINGEEQVSKMADQFDILAGLQHRNIVTFHGYTLEITKHLSRVYLITEFCEGGTLAELIASVSDKGCMLSEGFIWGVLYQLLLALVKCHSMKGVQNILHRNLVPHSIFLTGGLAVKLGDFTCSRQLEQFALAGTITGSPAYRAPELFNHQPYNEKSDMWSLGCVIYEMCTLRVPFSASNTCELARKVKEEEFEDIGPEYSSYMAHFIRDLLQKEPINRPSAKKMKGVLDKLSERAIESITDGNGAIIMDSVAKPVQDGVDSSRRFAENLNRFLKIRCLQTEK